MAKRTTLDPKQEDTVKVPTIDSANPPIAHRVFAWCCSTGPRAAPECLPIHEIALAKRRAESQGERIELLTNFHDGNDWTDRERPVTREPDTDVKGPNKGRFNGSISLQEEHERLTNRYKYRINDRDVDLMADLYGAPHQGRLIQILRRIAIAGRKLADRLKSENRKLTTEDLGELVALCDPTADFASTIDMPAIAGAK